MFSPPIATAGESVHSETQSSSTPESTAPSTSSTLTADEDDPDMLVLGFQELDLSAEALLYSTGTAREDAWCLAIFAGLGEKGALYEKVSLTRVSRSCLLMRGRL